MSLVWKYRRGKIWYLEYTRDLGRRRRSLHTSNERLAEAIRSKEENDILLSQYGIRYKPLQKIRYSELLSLFLEQKRSEGRAHNTIEAYRSALDNFGIFLGSDDFAHKIDRRRLEAFAAHRRLRGKSDKTIRNEVTILGLAFRWAQANGHAQEDPSHGIQLPRREKRPPMYLQRQQYLDLMRMVKDKLWRAIIKFYLLTGCREEEGTKILISEHLDLEAKILRIPMAKPGDFKTLPISEELLPVVQELLRHAKGSARLIPLHPDNLYHRFKKYAQQAGLPDKMTFHSLRHTFGTWLGQRGVAGPNLQELLGHKDAKSTQIYVHPVRGELRREIGKLRLPRARKR